MSDLMERLKKRGNTCPVVWGGSDGTEYVSAVDDPDIAEAATRISQLEADNTEARELVAQLRGELAAVAFATRIMVLTADADIHDSIWWKASEDSGPIEFFVNCNDLFFWAYSDAEPILASEVKDFAAALKDCGDEPEGALLFVCRQRKMRPQGAYYEYIDENLWPLFDACGPERETGFGNPCKPNDHKTRKPFGSVDDVLREELRVTKADLAACRDRYNKAVAGQKIVEGTS